MAASESVQILEDLLKTLEARISGGSSATTGDATATVAPSGGATLANTTAGDAMATVAPSGDAIQAVLGQEPRQTNVVSLRDAPAVESFRQALTDGLIRVDTANQLLQLINNVIMRFFP